MEAHNGSVEATNGTIEAANSTVEAHRDPMDDLLLEDEAQEGEIELVVQGRTIPVRNSHIITAL